MKARPPGFLPADNLMPFSDFVGNPETLHRMREMLGRNRFPHAVILSGARGAGKYTLALMLAQAMNCLSRPIPCDSGGTGGLPDFCGRCSNCARISQAGDFDSRFAEAVEARENLRDSDKKETRLFVQTHPDVLIIPPDPPQLMIKVDQVRHVIETIYYRPGEGRERVYIFTSSAFMKEAANSLLKVLEEPPEFATIFLLTETSGELLPTIRSRCTTFNLGALPAAAIESRLAQFRPEWNARQRALVARLSEGAVGRALSFDLDSYIGARSHALILLKSALGGNDHSELFRATETYRSGAEGRAKIDRLVRTLYSLLEDLMFLQSGAGQLVRNTDILGELKKMSESADLAWLQRASEGLGEVERGLRRNLLRSLSLDAFAAALERVS
ncbi:MAG: DNA polymerase III subunit delta' [Terriglobales bacterium]|jgi:DNA polymerase-3 subunit delta'